MGCSRVMYKNSSHSSPNRLNSTKKTSHQNKGSQAENCDDIAKVLSADKIRGILITTPGTSQGYGIRQVVFQLLDKGKKSTECIFDKNSKTSYRKIHDALVGVLDEADNLLKSNDGGDISRSLAIGLSKARILIDYQLSRGILKYSKKCKSQEGNCSIDALLKSLIDALAKELVDSSKDKQHKWIVIENARILINLFAALAEKLG
jgi:hypothetical protein